MHALNLNTKCRWIYWTDREVGTIERIAVTGEGRQAQLVRGGLGKCIWPLEIDYSKQTLYWVNTCVRVLRSLQISDSVQSADRVDIESSFDQTNSITLFENVLYWNEDKIIKATNMSNESGEIVQIYQASQSVDLPVAAVELVHTGKQQTQGMCDFHKHNNTGKMIIIMWGEHSFMATDIPQKLIYTVTLLQFLSH